MIHFYKQQVELALKLIDIKSKYDDRKASNDVTKIKTIINIANPTAEFVNAAKQLDKRINEDYPEINEMHNIASNMANLASICQDKPFSEYDAILDEAKSKTYEAANNIMANVYWNVGKRIIEQEQKSNRKAKYGSYLIKRLSQELSDEYGTGFQ